MLAEKFILLLEALIKSAQYPDGSYRVKNTSPHVPIELPTKKSEGALSWQPLCGALADRPSLRLSL